MKVRELLDSSHKWTKEHLAVDRYGNRVPYDSYKAVAWCLIGALRKCCQARDVPWEKLYSLCPHPYTWNDHPDRNFGEVKELVERLDL